MSAHDSMVKICEPLRYLLIRHNSKTWLDLIFPMVFAAIVTFIYQVVPVRPTLLGAGGLLYDLKDLLVFLSAFFLAALAAVATFGRESLDEVMAGTPPTLRTLDRAGKKIVKPLTRREFVSYLFGYLSFVSIVLFIIILGLKAFYPMLGYVGVEWIEYLRPVCVFLLSFMTMNLLCVTFLGLWFLTYRINADQ